MREQVTPPSSPISSQPSPISQPSSNTSSQGEASISDLSITAAQRKYRSLTDIYESYGFALMVTNPATFEDAQGQ